MDYRTVTENYAVAPQITLEDLNEIKRLGYVAVINNRPDNEQPGQPTSEQMQQAATAIGLSYFHLPIISGTLPPESVDETRATIAQIEGPIFAYCRSGTRSITLWALSQIGTIPGPEIQNAVNNAGYDLPFLEGFL